MKYSDLQKVKDLAFYYECLKSHLKTSMNGGNFYISSSGHASAYNVIVQKMSHRFIADIEEAIKTEISTIECQLESLGVDTSLNSLSI